MGFFDPDMEEMLEVFQCETTELIEEFSAQLLEAEKAGTFTPDGINRVFRDVHTIKSSSAMMGLDGMNRCTHQLEDLFKALREDLSRLHGNESTTFELMYDYADYIRTENERMSEADYQPLFPQALMTQIQEELKRYSQHQLAVRVRLRSDCQMEGVRAYMLLKRITPLCDSVVCQPEDLEGDGADEEIRREGIRLRLSTTDPDRVLGSIQSFHYTALLEEDVEPELEAQPEVQPEPEPEETSSSAPLPENLVPVQSEEAAQAERFARAERTVQAERAAQKKEAARPAAEHHGQSSRFCSIPWERVLRLQRLTSELITMESVLNNQMAELGGCQALEGFARNYHLLMEELERVVNQASMMPVSGVVQQLYRTVRDICKHQGKQVHFQVTGEDTLADRSLIDGMTAPLLHLIRNAVDHGVELPEERRRLGKSPEGQVTLDIFAAGGIITFRLQDDGKGLDEEVILSKAAQRGLLTKPAGEYTRREIIELLMQPGFSTAAQVSAYSGRGVGLDVVHSAVEALGGVMDVESVAGQGTTFLVQVPISATSLECLLFRVNGRCYLIPVRCVRQIHALRQAEREILIVDGREVFGRARLMPLLRLPLLLDDQPEVEERYILEAQGLQSTVALEVGPVLGRQVVVEKPLPVVFDQSYKNATGIQGCCMLGDGSLGLILNVDRLVQFGQRSKERGAYE